MIHGRSNIAQLSSYGAYIEDVDLVTTDSLIEGKEVLVGELAEYVYKLERDIARYEDYLHFLCNLPRLTQDHKGEYVIVSGKKFVSFHQTFEDAYNTACLTLIPGEFLIQQCLPMEGTMITISTPFMF